MADSARHDTSAVDELRGRPFQRAARCRATQARWPSCLSQYRLSASFPLFRLTEVPEAENLISKPSRWELLPVVIASNLAAMLPHTLGLAALAAGKKVEGKAIALELAVRHQRADALWALSPVCLVRVWAPEAA